MGINVEVTLDVKTCYCGGVYAVPHWLPPADYTCPMCAKRRYNELQERFERRWDEIQQLKRSNASLRGVMKRKTRDYK